MKEERPNTTTVLIDMRYKNSINQFQEFYGENISYQELEQHSYVELKQVLFEAINPDIKFRKYGRIDRTLTIKADMLESEITLLNKMLESNEIRLFYDWTITELTIITDDKINKEIED